MSDSTNSVVYDDADREAMLRVASDSIAHGLRAGGPLAVSPDRFSAALGEQRATFVTLQIQGKLRGCIGVLEAIRPLIVDIAHNAYGAAFSDPRFPPVSMAEQAQLDIHLSILSPAEPMRFTSPQDLLSQIRPGIDGLILEDGPRRGTFLPSVWESLPDASAFLAHLKNKAGLPSDYWSDTLRVWRYGTVCIA